LRQGFQSICKQDLGFDIVTSDWRSAHHWCAVREFTVTDDMMRIRLKG